MCSKIDALLIFLIILKIIFIGVIPSTSIDLIFPSFYVTDF